MKSSSPSFPDAEPIGSHLVITRSEWVPGDDPEPHRDSLDGDSYLESYYYCLLCGAERMRRRDFPEECSGAGPSIED